MDVTAEVNVLHADEALHDPASKRTTWTNMECEKKSFIFTSDHLINNAM